MIGLETDSALSKTAGEVLSSLRIDNAVIVDGELRAGYPRHAPYDAILIQGAIGAIPATLTAQMAEGGRLVAVLAPPGGTGRAVLALKPGGIVSHRELFEAATPPLPGFELALGFRF